MLRRLCGSVLGVIIGAAIGTCASSFNVKIGLLVASSMLSTMLGPMFAQLKYLVRDVPAISLINPARSPTPSTHFTTTTDSTALAE